MSNLACDLKVSYPTKVDAIPRIPRSGGSVTSVFSTTDLVSWTQSYSATLSTGPSSSSPFEIYVPFGFASNVGEKAFFRLAHGEYSDAL